MSAKFDEFPSLPFQDIKEKPRRHGRTDGHTDGKTDGQRENSIHPNKHSLRGYNKIFGILFDLSKTNLGISWNICVTENLYLFRQNHTSLKNLFSDGMDWA